MKDIEISRICDMRDGFKLQILKSGGDGDIHVSVVRQNDRASFDCVEFCATGSQSPHTFKALNALIAAMQKDAEERPQI